jgi:hypothetical protein
MSPPPVDAVRRGGRINGAISRGRTQSIDSWQ